VCKDKEGRLVAVDGHNLLAVRFQRKEPVDVVIIKSEHEQLPGASAAIIERNRQLKTKYADVSRRRCQTVDRGIVSFADLVAKYTDVFDPSFIAVTPGAAYSDIDGMGCAVAYAELLRAEGKDAHAVLPGRLNDTITTTVRSWKPEFATEAPADAKLVLVDVSNPQFIASWRSLDHVIEVYDHHSGAEQFWADRIGERAHIEFIGAACTLIWEQYVKRGHTEKISQTSARLLLTGILSNTLNFNAGLTHKRDRDAFVALKPLAKLPEDWPSGYYHEMEASIMADVKRAVADDTKVVDVPNLKLTVAIGQLELWDASDLLPKYCPEIKEALTRDGHLWFHTSPSISEGRNYLYTTDESVKKLLTRAIGAKFNGDIGHTTRLYLRKEILKALYALK
jgi:inorganic pyrophosphatase/exopolyphosphatase